MTSIRKASIFITSLQYLCVVSACCLRMYVVFKSDQKIHMCENFQVTSVYNVEKPWLWFIVRNGGVDTPYVLMFILQKKKKKRFWSISVLFENSIRLIHVDNFSHKFVSLLFKWLGYLHKRLASIMLSFYWFRILSKHFKWNNTIFFPLISKSIPLQWSCDARNILRKPGHISISGHIMVSYKCCRHFLNIVGVKHSCRFHLIHYRVLKSFTLPMVW